MGYSLPIFFFFNPFICFPKQSHQTIITHLQNWVINLVHVFKMISGIHVNLLVLFKLNSTFIHKMVIQRISLKLQLLVVVEGAKSATIKEHSKIKNT